MSRHTCIYFPFKFSDWSRFFTSSFKSQDTKILTYIFVFALCKIKREKKNGQDLFHCVLSNLSLDTLRMRKQEFRYIVCCHISLWLSSTILNSPPTAHDAGILFLFYLWDSSLIHCDGIRSVSLLLTFFPARYKKIYLLFTFMVLFINIAS